MGDSKEIIEKSSKLKNLASGVSLYATFPLGMFFGAGDTLLKPKDDPEISEWKKALKDNPISRIFTATVFVLGINQGIQQGTGLAFDDAEEYLKQAGYPEHVVSSFADDNIKIRHRNSAGIAHTAHDAPPLNALFAEMTRNRVENDSIPSVNSGLGTFLSMNKWTKLTKPYAKDYLNEFVTLPKEDATSEDIISQFNNTPANVLNSLDVEDEPLRQAMVLYALKLVEHRENGEHVENTKVDALIYAFETVSEIHDDPDLKKMVFPLVALDFVRDSIKDDAFAYDAERQGAPVPNKQEVRSAIKELSDLFPYDYSEFSDNTLRQLEIFEDILKQHSDDLSPLARRRAEMFVEGARHFIPEPTSHDVTINNDQLDRDLSI